MGIAFTIAMPSIIITLYFGEVSFIPVNPFLVKSEACVISVALHLLVAFVVRGNTRGCFHGWSEHDQLFITY